MQIEENIILYILLIKVPLYPAGSEIIRVFLAVKLVSSSI